MSLLHTQLYLIYSNCYFPISSSISFSLVTLCLSLSFLPSTHDRHLFFFFFFFLALVICYFKRVPSYLFSFESFPIYLHLLCHRVYFKLSPTRAVAISFSCQLKDSLKNLHVVYESVFKLVLHTKLDRTFLPSVQSSCKELHRRRFHCTTTNFIGLGNPRDYTTQ